MIFLGKLNNLELWGDDIGNAYLEAFTDEKLFIVAGPEFQELEGYILIFLKALYGLKSSGKRWAEVIHGILRDMKFLPSKADPCIWLRKAPFARTAPSWKRAFPGTPGMHMIELRVHNQNTHHRRTKFTLSKI